MIQAEAALCELRPRGAQAPGLATDRETPQGQGAGRSQNPTRAAPQGTQYDLCGLCWLPEGQAGAVVPLRVDVGEDSNEEGWWVPLRTQLPPTGLAKLSRRGVGVGRHPLSVPVLTTLHPGPSVADSALLCDPGCISPPGPQPSPPQEEVTASGVSLWPEHPVVQDMGSTTTGRDMA